MLSLLKFCVYVFIQEPYLILKRFRVLRHTLSAYNSFLVRDEVYSSNPKKCLCTRWRYGEAYTYLIIDPWSSTMLKESYKKQTSHTKMLAILLGENYTEKKNVAVKTCLENFVRNILKDKNLRTFKASFDNWY